MSTNGLPKDIQAKLTMTSTADEDKNQALSNLLLTSIFPLSVLHEEGIILNILSFVADVPFESSKSNARSPIDCHSTLTHVLPLVSKQFHSLVRQDDFWRAALLRLIDKEPYLWKEGLKRITFNCQCDEIRDKIRECKQHRRRDKRTRETELSEQQQQQIESQLSPQSAEPQCLKHSSIISTGDNQTDEDLLLDAAREAFSNNPPQHQTANTSGIYKCLYQSILNKHVRFQAPVFYMQSDLRLGDAYGLHFFEPRYRVLMAEVMSSFPAGARRGGQIQPLLPGIHPQQPDGSLQGMDDVKLSILNILEKNISILSNHHLPCFIHAHQSPLRRNTPAAIVQVRQCSIQPDGSADVLLEPIAYIYLESIWERPGTGGLLEARGMRMSKDASQAFEMWTGMSRFGRGDGRGREQQLPIP